MNSKIFILESAGSSNTEAMSFAKKGDIPEGSIIWVKNQTQGRGQSNKKWFSKPSKNLTFSMIFYPDFLPIEHQFALSKMVAVSVSNVIKKCCKNVSIKWPNDIYVNDSKICGILIENSLNKDKINICVMGIGLNINQTEFPKNIPNPTSLKLEKGKDFNLEEMLSFLQKELKKNYNALKKLKFKHFEAPYDKILYKKNQLTEIKIKNQIVLANIEYVDSKGLLHTQINGQKQLFAVGDIEWIIK